MRLTIWRSRKYIGSLFDERNTTPGRISGASCVKSDYHRPTRRTRGCSGRRVGMNVSMYRTYTAGRRTATSTQKSLCGKYSTFPPFEPFTIAEQTQFSLRPAQSHQYFPTTKPVLYSVSDPKLAAAKYVFPTRKFSASLFRDRRRTAGTHTV